MGFHKGKRIESLSRLSFLSESSTSKGIVKHLAIMVLTANGLRVDITSLCTENWEK